MDNNKDNNKYHREISDGNDESEGDTRDEARVDKDDDLKTGNDEGSPLAADFDKEKKHKIEPDSLSTPDRNHGHNKHSMDEHEEPDPTDEDTPELKTEYPGEKPRNQHK